MFISLFDAELIGELIEHIRDSTDDLPPLTRQKGVEALRAVFEIALIWWDQPEEEFDNMVRRHLEIEDLSAQEARREARRKARVLSGDFADLIKLHVQYAEERSQEID